MRRTKKLDLDTEREHLLTTGKRAERTKRVFRCVICRPVIGQATCLICARCRQVTFPVCFIYYKNSFKTVVMQSSPRTVNRLKDSGDRRSGARCAIIITQLHHNRNVSLKNKLARGFGNNVFSIFLNR